MAKPKKITVSPPTPEWEARVLEAAKAHGYKPPGFLVHATTIYLNSLGTKTTKADD